MNPQQHPTLEQLTDYVHGELAPHDDAAVHAHLAGCAACSEARDAEVRLGEILREHARAQERELPPGFAARVLAATAERDGISRWKFDVAQLLRPVVAFPIAAAFALAAYLGIATLHGPRARATTIDAAYYLEDHAALAADMPLDEGSSMATVLASDGTH